MKHLKRYSIAAAVVAGAMLLSATVASASGGSGGGGGGGGGGTKPVATTVPSGGGTGGGGGGGGGKATCTNTLALTASATEALSGNAFQADYTLVSCQSKTHVAMTATDLTTGAIVWSNPDVLGTVALWTLPYTLTSYRIDARAVAGSTNTVVATASAVVETLNALPCDVMINETATVGYFGIYPAIWAATDARDCGRGDTSVGLRITNLTTGAVSLNYGTLPMSSFIDFEGAIVEYATPYRIEAELHTSSGEVLASSSTDVMSSPLR